MIDLLRWWDKGAKGERHKYVLPYVHDLERAQREVHRAFLQDAWLYHQCGLMGLDGEWDAPEFADLASCTTNICENAVDAACALIAKHRPAIEILTDGADYSVQQRAKLLKQYVMAEFERTGFYDVAWLAFRDAAVFGTGVIHVYAKHGRVAVERIIPDEIRVDEREWRCGRGRQVHRIKFVDRDVAKAWKFVDTPEKKAAIDKAASEGRYTDSWTFRKCERGFLPIVESHRLPSGPDAGDGVHTISAEGVDLFDEPWEEEDFPYLFIHWSPRLTGFYGRGLVRQLAPKQLRVNKLNWVIQRSEDLVARPRLFLKPRDAHLATQISNSLEDFVYLTNTGHDYEFQTGKPLDAAVYASRRGHIDEAYEMVGMSQAAASGQKPAGVESAIAIREVADRETGRFAPQAQRFEDLHLKGGEKLIALQRKLSKDGNPGVAVWKSHDIIKRIPWEKVDLDADRYVMDLAAASLLPHTPAARAQTVIELAQANAIDRPEMRELIDIPDLDRSRSYDLGVQSRRALERVTEILEDLDRDYPYPSAYLDLELGQKMVHARMLEIEGMNAPPEVLQRFQDWLTDAGNEVEKKLQEAAAVQAAMMQGAAPGMAPGMTPGAQVPGMGAGLPGSGDELGAGLAHDPKTVTPLNPPGGLPDSFVRLSPGSMGLTSR